MLPLAIAIFSVILASALASGAEAALLSVPYTRVALLAEERVSGAKTLLALKDDLSRAISAIVILNNVSNIVGSMVIASMATEAFGSSALGIISGVVTVLIILFAEIVPKAVGERYAESISLRMAGVLRLLILLLSPIIWIISLLTRFLGASDRPSTNEAEIRFLARSGGDEGVIENDESEMIERVFQLNDATAGDIMTPRVALSAIPGTASLREIETYARNSEHSRLIIFGRDKDEPTGFALRLELLGAMLDGKWDAPVQAFARQVHRIDIGTKADALLPFFRAQRAHIAVVDDGYGGVAGVVSLEDVLEVLTGEIVDETDRTVDLQAAAKDSAQSAIRPDNEPSEGSGGSEDEGAGVASRDAE